VWHSLACLEPRGNIYVHTNKLVCANQAGTLCSKLHMSQAGSSTEVPNAMQC
jgi:hypothetical protein